MDLIVKGGTLVTPAGVYRADLGVREGKIESIAAEIPSAGADVLEAGDRWIFPGGIDVHCHLPWPSKDVVSGDDVQSGTRAAICGGVTTVLDFVIPEIGQTLVEALEAKLAETRRGLYADYSAHICVREVTAANLAQIADLVRRGFPSFKVFMAYEGFRLEDKDILKLMETVSAAGGIVSVHAENGLLADDAGRLLVEKGKLSPQFYPESRPAACEHEAIQRILTYAAAKNVALHIHHVSTGKGARLLGAARRGGQAVTGETCPQYLLFNDDAYRLGGVEATYLVIAPPLRRPEDQSQLWESLACDELSVVATDHCPYTLAQKKAGEKDFTRVPGGTAGVETRWPLLFTEGVSAGRISAERLALVWAMNPARIFGLHPRKGSLSIGADADLIIVDPQRETRLGQKMLHMRTDFSVYENKKVIGFPLTTLLRGRVVVREGEPVGEPAGQVIARSRPQAV